MSTVKLFCPCCQNAFHPSRCLDRQSKIAGNLDGAYFGTTFAHLLIMTFKDQFSGVKHCEAPYVPKVFGFKVYQESIDDIKGSDHKSRKGGSSSSSSSSGNYGSKGGSNGGSDANKLLQENARLRERVRMLEQQTGSPRIKSNGMLEKRKKNSSSGTTSSISSKSKRQKYRSK
jgi:hypothetical protein